MTGLWLAFVAAAASAAPADANYDLLTAEGLQLLVNPSFERIAREGKLPEGWDVVRSERPRLRVKTDSAGSKHGARFVVFAPSRRRYLYGRLRRVVAGKLRFSVWAKGQGRLRLMVTLLAPDWRNRKRPVLKRLYSPWFALRRGRWTRFAHEFDAPATVENQGKRERPEAVTVQIGVEGTAAFDQCSVVEEAAVRRAAGRLAAARPRLEDWRPFVSIPRLSKPPVIDGRLAPDEWAEAAAVTGFSVLNRRRAARRQTVAYLAHDGRRLYVAFRCPHEGAFGAGKPGRDAGFTSQTEGVEIWVQPPGGPWRQFLGWPAGGFLDIGQNEGHRWNGRWTFRCRVADSGETVGGVLTFSKKLWTAEVSVPFADLGAAPRPGQAWRMNVCRDFSVGPGRNRRGADWTSWSPITDGFANTREFARVVFAPDAPGVQWLALGDLENGDLAVRGRCFGRQGRVRIEAWAVAAKDGKTLAFLSKTFDLARAHAAEFALSDTLRVAGATDVKLLLRAVDADAGRVLDRAIVPFTARAALRLRLVPAPARGRLFVHIDASRSPGLPERFVADARVVDARGAERASASAQWTKKQPAGDLEMSIADLPPGEYAVKAFVRPAAGAKALASSTGSFVMPKRPPWLGNRIGVADDVPPPWTPVRANDDRVEVTQRTYALTPLGLPAQITALGEPLLAAPARPQPSPPPPAVRWECRPLKVVERRPDRVVWRLQGRAGPLELTGRLTVEFDGFALWDATIRPAGAARVDALALVFPLKKARALYARGRNACEDNGAYHACLYESARPGAADICAAHFSARGWTWPDKWMHEIWVGGDRRGLSVMCETQANLFGAKRTVIQPHGGAQVLKIYLVDGPARVARPLRYRYAWQATPVKPRPANPRLWRACYGRHNEPGFLRRAFVTTAEYHALKYISYPALYYSKASLLRRLAPYRRAGVKATCYFAAEGVTVEAADLKPFLGEWETRPLYTFGGLRGRWMTACLADSSFADFILWSARKIIDEFKLGGLYLDVSSVHACANRYHGCGYRAADGEWRPTVDIFAAREAYKRLYRLCHTQGRDAVLFRHGMPVAAIAGFVDVVTQGEDWCREGTRQYDRLTPDIFRAKCMRIQYGTPYTWYVFHHYYRGVKFGGRVPLHAILAYCLPHRVLPAEGRPGMWPVWDAFAPFWTTADFIPYWDPRSPARTGDADVLATVYLKKTPRQALLVVANWSRRPKRVNVRLDLNALGFRPGRVRVTRALPHPIVEPEDPKPDPPVENYPLALRGDALPLRLGARNLEVIRLEER